MNRWDEIFRSKTWPLGRPDKAVFKLVSNAEAVFEERPLRFWDHCCGLGRNTIALAGSGHETYGSDGSGEGISMTGDTLSENGLSARLEVADMAVDPWPGTSFHAAVSWNSIHHNTLSNIHETVALLRRKLLPGGFLLANLLSTNTDRYQKGEEIEKDTFVDDELDEKGIPHHYFDEEGVGDLLVDFTLVSLVEQKMDYKVRGDDFMKLNPFTFTKWLILARRP